MRKMSKIKNIFYYITTSLQLSYISNYYFARYYLPLYNPKFFALSNTLSIITLKSSLLPCIIIEP